MSELIPSDAVQAIKDSVQVTQIAVDGATYVSRAVQLPPSEPLPDTLEVHTLTGVAEFCNTFDKSKIAYIHIESASSVKVWGDLEGRHRNRPCYLAASLFSERSFSFGRPLSQEDFIVGVQSGFVESENRTIFLRVAGNITEDGSVKASDDGVSQSLAIRQGVSLDSSLEFQNPVYLAPFRTFPEIPQPVSPYLFRVDKGPTLALHETHETEWQLTAIKAIAEFLSKRIEGVSILQ